ncbi:CHAT domain-containing protein [Mycena galopus ATCC 62051]|nr:CHAT domain-containing protein [Mycena galopus ATCC 62051]
MDSKSLGLAIELNSAAEALQERFEQQGKPKDIEDAIKLFRQALALSQPTQPNCDSILHNLGSAILSRFELGGEKRTLMRLLNCSRRPCRGKSLETLARALSTRFRRWKDLKDINETVEIFEEVLTIYTPPHPDHARLRFQQQGDPNDSNRAVEIYRQQSNSNDIDEAIELYRESLALHPAPHGNHGLSLDHLATALKTRFEQQGNSKDVDEAIELHRQALAHHAQPHPKYNMSLNNLATALQSRFKQLGNSDDIDEAAVALHAPSHANRARCLNSLAVAVRTRFDWQGDAKDIDEAIDLQREALVLCLPPHPERGLALNNLATVIRARFQQKGDSKDIDEAIELHRQALVLHASPHPDRDGSLNNLANALSYRFKHQSKSNFSDIEEAIELHRQALARASSLNNLALVQGDAKDIYEAIELHREALALRPPPHPDHGANLNNLAIALKTRFEQHGDSRDIDEAIALYRDCLAFYTSHHPNVHITLDNLADALSTRFDKQGTSMDLDEAIELKQEVVNLRKPPHADRGFSLATLGLCLVNKYRQTNHSQDLEHGCLLLQEATRFHSAKSWATIARSYHHSSVLPQLAALHLDLPSRQQMMSSTQGLTLASDAATCAVESGQYDTAVEFLEASRSIFWSQALQLRTPLDALASNIARQLEQGSFRDTSRNVLTDTQQKLISIESEGARCRRLNGEWEEIIRSVRMLPGFEDFMQPKRMSALREAAVSGPIIILTASTSACFALIVTLSKDVQYLKLPQIDLPQIQHLVDLSRGLSNPAVALDTLILPTLEHGSHPENPSDSETRLIGELEGYTNVHPENVFRKVLADLWRDIAKPVLDALNLKKSSNPSRLWWCPTGRFAFLPLHAAGIYGPDITDCTSDYVVSSYTPTLAALLNPPLAATTVKMTAVIQPQTPNCSALPGAREELEKIAQRVPNQWLTALGDTAPATVQPSLLHLRESQIMHFACHGTQDLEHPLDSGLILTNGRLKVSEIMRWPEGNNALNVKKSMSLAFLSACETAKGDKAVPDEAMHLAATFLFLGFRGVVATMWTMNDLDGPKVADAFYEHLFKNCKPTSDPRVLPDLTQAAKALHVAVGKLREDRNIPFSQWVPFVHYGL